MQKQHKPIIGGIFGTHTEWDENGNVVVKDDFHLRIYWDLWHSGAIKKLKGNMLHVYLTIAMHLDRRGEGWPTQEQIAKLCGINRETVVNAIKKLVEAGFIEAEKVRTQGKFDNTIYKIKFAPQTSENNHDGKFDMEEIASNQHFDHDGKSDTVTMSEKPSRKNRHGKSDTKKEESFKKDPLDKDHDDDDQPHPWENDHKYLAFRELYIAAGAADIKKHDEHYQKFLSCTEALGYDKLIELAEKHVKQDGEHAQIVWFLADGWRNFMQPKVNKIVRYDRLPKSIQKAQQQATTNPQPIQPGQQDDEPLEVKQARIQAKLKLMNERLGQRKSQKLEI